jgi:hypothetical protein
MLKTLEENIQIQVQNLVKYVGLVEKNIGHMVYMILIHQRIKTSGNYRFTII